MFVIKREHEEMAAELTKLAQALEVNDGATVARQAKTSSHALCHHIDAENSVLLPESGERLRRNSVLQLNGRAATVAELEARAEGEALLRRSPPFDDRELFRGDGCVMCPASGVRCDGLERMSNPLD